MRRSWIEIHIDQIRDNYNIYKRSIKDYKDIMAVVKADAYGLGDVEVMKCLSKEGVKNWAVSNIDEACRLRKAGCVGQILILGYTPINQLWRLEKYDITQALVSEEYAAAVQNSGYQVACQFAIDTGMNRIGLDADQLQECEKVIRYYSNKIKLTGLFTHLCVADIDNEDETNFTYEQISKFENVVKVVADLNLPYIHCLNSSGGLRFKVPNCNLIRLGIILYGLKPSYENSLPEGIRSPFVWKSVISLVKKVRVGESIGYGRTFVADHDMVVATIPTGYADGYNRQLSNKGYVIINNCKAPIVGRICMDQFMVDVSQCPAVKMGDEVILLNDTYNADEMAEQISTIGYEVVCNISKRVPRIYL